MATNVGARDVHGTDHPLQPLQPETPIQGGHPVVREAALSVMEREIQDKVTQKRGLVLIGDQRVDFNFQVTFGTNGVGAEIEESKLEQLAEHATAAFESTYELTKAERNALRGQTAQGLQLTSKQKARLKELDEHIYAFENLSAFTFTPKFGKPYLVLESQSPNGKPIKISIELNPECSGVLAVIQNQINRYERDLARLQNLADRDLLPPDHAHYPLYQRLLNDRHIWSDPDNYDIRIITERDHGATIPYITLYHPETGHEIYTKPVETADERLVQKVSGRKSKIQDVFDLLHVRFREAINDEDSDFAEKSGYNQYQADRTGRVPRRAGTDPDQMRRMMQQMAAAQ